MAGFDAPFRRSELVGFFRWTDQLTGALAPAFPWLYHACHRTQLRLFHRRNKLFRRSTFEVEGADGGTGAYACVWAALQPWHQTHGHNHFGPLTIKMPVEVLTGRRFYVFERNLRGWTHYYLVQRETTSPLFGNRRASRLDPRMLFCSRKAGRRLVAKEATQYEIVLTKTVPLADARFIATDHDRCVPRVCSGASKRQSLKSINALVAAELEKLARRFPQQRSRILAAVR